MRLITAMSLLPALLLLAPSTSAIELPEAIDYDQCASPWLNDPMGQPDICYNSICSTGCTMTCVAMLLSWVALEPGNPDPRVLNDWLRDNGGYMGCNMFWGAADDYDGAGSGLEWQGRGSGEVDDWSELDAELDAADRMPLASVRSGGHWVVVYDRVGPSGNPSSYLVLDPAEPFSPTRTLADYVEAEGTVIDISKFSGTFPMGSVSNVAMQDAPPRPTVYQNFPNPFNPGTTIAFDLARAGVVDLRIYDCAGRLVDVLMDREIAVEGRNEIVWRGMDRDGRPAPAGTYVYRLEIGDYVETKRMTLLK